MQQTHVNLPLHNEQEIPRMNRSGPHVAVEIGRCHGDVVKIGRSLRFQNRRRTVVTTLAVSW